VDGGGSGSSFVTDPYSPGRRPAGNARGGAALPGILRRLSRERGDGRGIAAPSFGGKIADFTNPEYWKKADDKKIAAVILKGQGRMPAQSVSPEEARAIVEYMKSAFKGAYGS
jgi:hypothetical protein